MNGTTPLNTPRMIYHWKEERKGNLECHLRISVSLRRPELWGGFANRPEFSEINAQLFVSRVRVRSGILSGCYATSLGTGSYLGWACVGILSLGGRGLEFEWGNIVSEIGEARFLSFPPLL